MIKVLLLIAFYPHDAMGIRIKSKRYWNLKADCGVSYKSQATSSLIHCSQVCMQGNSTKILLNKLLILTIFL